MKHSLKHKIFFGLAAVALFANFSIAALPFSASAQEIVCPSGTKLNNKDDTLCCPSGQLPTQVHGQGVQRSCCPASAVKKAMADGKGSDSKTDGLTAKYCLFSKYLNPTVNALTAVVGLAAAAAIIFGAIQVSSSAGDPQKAANGKNHIRNALVGLLAYILLYSFLQFIIPGGRFNG
jgi:hypothetical protein